MSIKPILFNTEMVNAILDGRKTVTRRIIKDKTFEGWVLAGFSDDFIKSEKNNWADSCLYHSGDILYVRETWLRIESCSGCMCDNEPITQDGCYLYRATHGDAQGLRWHPSIHMPKEAARIWLLVKNVRVERLQDITQEDALLEGVKDPYDYQAPSWYEQHNITGIYAIDAFAGLWDSTIKPAQLPLYGWDANPWVWAIEFERCEKPKEATR